MKNKNIKVTLLIIVILTSLFCLSRYISVKADSGWDTDYDSDSSWDSDWDSGSSWDNDYSSDDSGYYGNKVTCTGDGCRLSSAVLFSFFASLFLIPLVVYFGKLRKFNIVHKIKIALGIIIIIVSNFCGKYFLNYSFASILLLPLGFIFGLMIILKQFKSVKRDNYVLFNNSDIISKYNQMTQEQVDKVIPNFNIEEFNFKAYQIFYDTQIGWMEFDYNKLKNILTDELYNSYEMDLEVLKVKNQKNIMKDFELINTKLISLKEVNNIYTAKLVIRVKFIDYIEDSKTKKVVRGNSTRKVDNTYILTFIKANKEKQENVCPNCGAKVDGNTTGICKYCKSKLINDSYDWVMSKKEKISQK